MTTRFRTCALMLACALAVGCTPPPTTITNVNVNTNTINGKSGEGDPAAVPGSVTKDTVTVTINGFVDGEKCPSGIAPANQNGKFRKGCELAITVNPRNGAGQVIHDDNAPPPDYFVFLGPDAVASFEKHSNPYNASLKGLAPGVVKVIAGVNGKRSQPDGGTPFEVVP